MPPAPMPANEAMRLAALRAYAALDGTRDQLSDGFASIAAAIAGCPIATVSIVEEHRQWFRGCLGLDIDCTGRAEAFCGYTILGDGPMVVEDARLDPRFADNPLVIGPPGIRFYAGLPLIDARGMAIGAVCVIHTEPHRINEHQLSALARLAGVVLSHLTQEHRADRAEASLAARSAECEALVNARRELEIEIARRDALVGQLNDAIARAEGASRAKSAFLANISHEFRTPMTAILGYAELLERESIDPLTTAERMEALASIARNGHHLLSIINDLLDLSKVEAGKLEVERMPTSVRALIEQVVGTMRESLRNKPVRLLTETSPEVPERMLIDPTRVRQILFNLVANAIKFTHMGSVTIRTQVDPYESVVGPGQRSRRLRIDVIDTGIGMSRQQCAQLFKPFVQGDSSFSRRFGGTGLGLCISSEIAGLLGGCLEVRSELGKGSCFTLALPLECEDHEGDTDRAPSDPVMTPDGREEGGDLVGRRILMIEDGQDNRRLIAFHLGRAGAIVEHAENGLEGIERIREAIDAGRPHELVLMDIQMPELDGYAATTRLRSEGLRIPIIALTAHAMAGERERCLGVGCDDYLTKPIDRVLLLGRCAAHLATNAVRHGAA